MKLIVVATSAIVLLVCHAMLADAVCDATTITKCSTDFGKGIVGKTDDAKALCPLYTTFNKCLTDLTCGDAMKQSLNATMKVQSDLYGEMCKSGASHVSYAAVLLAGSLLLVNLVN